MASLLLRILSIPLCTSIYSILSLLQPLGFTGVYDRGHRKGHLSPRSTSSVCGMIHAFNFIAKRCSAVQFSSIPLTNKLNLIPNDDSDKLLQPCNPCKKRQIKFPQRSGSNARTHARSRRVQGTLNSLRISILIVTNLFHRRAVQPHPSNGIGMCQKEPRNCKYTSLVGVYTSPYNHNQNTSCSRTP